MLLGFEFTAAKSKKTSEEDERAATEPMRPLTTVRRNPSTDQKKVRRAMQRKTAAAGAACPRCGGTDVSTGLHGPDQCGDCGWWGFRNNPIGDMQAAETNMHAAPMPIPTTYDKPRYAGSRTAATEGPYKVQVAGNGEHVWSENALRFQTPEEAKAYASDLLGRWMGADLARVVPSETPNREPVDPNDPAITHNYRTGSLRFTEVMKTAARSCDSCGGDENVTADRTLGKDLCNGCKRALQSRRRKSTEAVNESAQGADRYEKTPAPRKPGWINDELTDTNTAPSEGGAEDSDSPVPDWDDRGDALKDMEERRRAIVDADEGYLSPGWDEKVTAGANRTEAQILSDLSRTRDYPTQQVLAAELAQVRAARVASVQAAKEVDLTNTVLSAHAATPFAHSLHTTATDWLDEVDVAPDTAEGERDARADAAMWVARLHEAVLAEPEEFVIQATGKAQAFAGRFGENAPIVASAYLDAADRAARQRTAGSFPSDPAWKDHFLTDRYSVPEEAKDPQRPGATTEKGADAEHPDEEAFDEGWVDDNGNHKVSPPLTNVARRVTAEMWDGIADDPAPEAGVFGEEEGIADVAPEFGLPDAGMAFARLEANLGQRVPMGARPFVAALSACASLDTVVAGVPARDIARNAAALTEGWGGAQGESIRTALRALADSQPPWLNKGSDDDDDSDDDSDSKSDDDKDSDDDSSKSDSDSKSDDDSDKDADDDSDDSDDDDDDDDDKKEASLLGSPVTAQFRDRVQASMQRMAERCPVTEKVKATGRNDTDRYARCTKEKGHSGDHSPSTKTSPAPVD